MSAIRHVTHNAGTAMIAFRNLHSTYEHVDQCGKANLQLGLLLGHGHCHHADAAADTNASTNEHDEAEDAQRNCDGLVHNHGCRCGAGR